MTEQKKTEDTYASKYPEKENPTEKKKPLHLPVSLALISTSGGCTSSSPNALAVLGRESFYINGSCILGSSGISYSVPEITPGISSFDVDAEHMSIGTSQGQIAFLSMHGDYSADEKSGDNNCLEEKSSAPNDAFIESLNRIRAKIAGQPIFSIRHLNRQILCSTYTHAYFIQGSQILEIPTASAVVDCSIAQVQSTHEGNKTLTYLVLGMYSGVLTVFSTSDCSQRSSVAANGSIKTVSTRISSEVSGTPKLHICVGYATGNVGVFEYSIKTTALRRACSIPAHRSQCSSAKWTPVNSILTSSMDGTASTWEMKEAHWVCTKRVGNQGSPLYSAVADAHGAVHALAQGGGICVFGIPQRFFPKKEKEPGEHILGGHTRRVRSVEVRNGLILTASDDRTIRMFRIEQGRAVEVFRPLTGGHAIASASFITENTLIAAPEDTVMRVLEGTQLFAHSVSAGEKKNQEQDLPLECKNIPFTAGKQELSLTNLPVFAISEEEKDQILRDFPTDVLLRTQQFHETQKVYGHPFESACVKCLDGSLILSASRASQKQHASLFITDARTYEVKERIDVHSLGITQIITTETQEHILTVGRDRLIAIFRYDRASKKVALLDTACHHRRAVLAAAFVEVDAYDQSRNISVITTGKDKMMHIYTMEEAGKLALEMSVHLPFAATGLAAVERREPSGHTPSLLVLCGTSEGVVAVGVVQERKKNQYHYHILAQVRICSTEIENITRYNEDTFVCTNKEGMLAVLKWKTQITK